MVEARPDLGLPAAVEVLDGGLEPAFPGRREHGRDVEAQAGPHHAPHRIAMLMRPLRSCRCRTGRRPAARILASGPPAPRPRFSRSPAAAATPQASRPAATR